MTKKLILCFLTVIVMLGMLVSGCGPKVSPPETGALVDEVVFSVEESHGAAVLKLGAGDLDIYAFSISNPDLFETIQNDPNIDYNFAYGGYRELRFNTAGPVFSGTGKLNPFAVAEVREAINWLIDRDYIVDEYLGGMGQAKTTVLGTQFPDHAIRYPNIVQEIADYYAYNPTKAQQVIADEMAKLGATLVGGKWQYNGEPVTITLLIRADLAPYPAAGHYLADQLESIGFQTVRDVKIGADASQIWLGDVNAGLFHIYTGGWSSTVIPRDSGAIFDQMYTHRVMSFPIFTSLQAQLEAEFPLLDEASRKLRYKEFSTMEEREALFETALWEGVRFSNCIWVLDLAGVYAHSTNIGVASDVAAGIGDPMWVFTAHFQENGEPVYGGTLRIGAPNVLLDPWNPVDGSAFVYDNFLNRRALGNQGILPDPRDGLYWPQRIEKAEVTVKDGLPVASTNDWVTLSFAPTIQVPSDAWADWDAANQKWITAGEKFGSAGATASRKSVVTYSDDLWDVPLQDGSTLSMGDFVMSMIMGFDRGKEASPIYDASKAGSLTAFLNTFKGVKIVSTDPLVIETYSDVWYMDAELNVSTWYPVYGTYEWTGFWHNIAVGWLADADKLITFTKSKSDELKVDWMDYTKGPSLPILKAKLDSAAASNFIPYAPTMGDYITSAEATARWNNLQEFYAKYGHFWVGDGPYILKSVFAVEKIVVLEAYPNYPDEADKWLFVLEPLAVD